MNAKHTPGPWTLRDEGDAGLMVYCGTAVAQVFSTTSDAHLIAAAPELLEAARALMPSLGDAIETLAEPDSELAFRASALRAAITKAEGSQ